MILFCSISILNDDPLPDEEGAGQEDAEGHLDESDASGRERRARAQDVAEDGHRLLLQQVHLTLDLQRTAHLQEEEMCGGDTGEKGRGK